MRYLTNIYFPCYNFCGWRNWTSTDRKENHMDRKNREDIARYFKEQTGLEAVRIFQIGLNAYMVEAEDGNTYKIG